jgi:CRP-like cAMP-binding protein
MKVTDVSKLRTLQKVPKEELEHLLELSDEVHFAPGQVVFEPGTLADHALLLVQGRFEVELPDGSRTLGDVWPGEIVGETAFFHDAPLRTARVKAVLPSRAAVITRELLESQRGTRGVATLQAHLVAVLARRIHSTNLAIRKAWQEQRAAEGAARAPTREPEPAPPTLGERLKDLLGGFWK